MVLANRMLAVALSCRQGWVALFTGVIMVVEFLANTASPSYSNKRMDCGLSNIGYNVSA